MLRGRVPRGKAPEPIGKVLAEFLDQEGVRDDLDRLGVLDEWAERVGPAIAGVTRARDVAEGTLVVEVRSSAWLMELNMMKREIVERLNQGRATPVEKLVFVLSPEG